MKRFIWIAVIFGGGMVALLLAAIILMQQTRQLGPQHNLRAALLQARAVLLEWDYDALTQKLPEGQSLAVFEKETYRQLFDDAHADAPSQKARWQTFLSLIDSFPTVRFDESQVEVAATELHYDVHTEGCQAKLGAVFGRSPEDGWTAYRVVPVVALTPSTRAVTFVEGQPVPLKEIFEKLFRALLAGEKELGELVEVPPDATAADVLGDIRRSVTQVGNQRVAALLPEMSALPRGVQALRLRIDGRARGRALRLMFELEPVEPPRFRSLRITPMDRPGEIEIPGPVEEEETAPTPPEADNAPATTPPPAPQDAP